MNSFSGFSREMPNFLFGLHFNNTIDNQAKNIEQYKELVTEPLKLLYGALLPTVCQINDKLETRPSRCISSPYTDRRFSRDVPLKEYMYIRFKQSDKLDNITGLYFDMGSDSYSYGMRIYKQNIKGMNIIREKIDSAPDKFTKALDMLAENKFEIIGESYKNDRCPLMSDCSAKHLYNLKAFYICKNVPINENVFSEKLSEEISDGFKLVSEILTLVL